MVRNRVETVVCAGDRRVRVRTPGMVTCSAYAVRSTIGPVALVGTNEGEVDVYELLSGRWAMIFCILHPPTSL
jgi:hypothetical protein